MDPAAHPPTNAASRRLDIGFPTMLRVVAVVGLTWLAIQLWPIVLVIVVALVLVGALAPAVAWVESRKVRRGLAIGIVFGGLLLVVGGFLALTVPHLVGQLSDMVERLPQTQNDLATQLEGSKLTAPLARSVRGTTSSDLVAASAQTLLSYTSKIVHVVAYTVTSIFLALYLIIDRDRMRGAAFALVPRTYHVRLSRILLNLETIVGGYVRGQLITSLMMAVFTFVVLKIAGVPNGVALAAFAGVADVLPYVGAILGCGPAVLAAFSAHGTPAGVGVLVALVAYQEIESRVIVPRVYGHALRLPPAIVLLALLAGGTLLGILGALLALPIAAGIRMVVEELRFELPGEAADHPDVRARDASVERSFARRAAGAPAEEAAAIATEIAAKQIEQDAAAGAEPTTVPISTTRP